MNETLVLVHGWGMPGSFFTPLVERLKQRFNFIIPKLPGDKGMDYQGENTLADFTSKVMRQVDGPAHWLGWSLGGLVSLKAAALKPKLVKSLILVTSSPKFVSDETWTYGIKQDVLKKFSFDLKKDYKKTIMQFLTLQTMYMDKQRDLIKELKNNFNFIPELKSLQAQLQLLTHYDLRDELLNIPQDILWILGGKDMLVPPGTATGIRKIKPCNIKILEKSGHMPFLSHSKIFDREIVKWIG